MARIRTAKLSSTRAMVTDVIQISGQRMQYSSASDQLGLPQVCGLTSLRSANQVQASGTAHGCKHISCPSEQGPFSFPR